MFIAERGMFIAERGGFEPPEPTRSSTVFETAPFDHSGISPKLDCKYKCIFPIP